MELNREARKHWIDIFARCLDEGTDTEVVRLTLRLEMFLERCDERNQSEDGKCGDDENEFDFGTGY